MENHNEGQRQTRRKPAKRQGGCLNTLLYMAIIIGLSIICSVVALFAANDVLALIKDNRTIVITVDEETTVGQMASTLDKAGVIDYGLLFKMFVSFSGKDGEVAPGDYELNPAQDYGAIIRELKSVAASTTVKLTIPEGYTVQQIRAAILEKGICPEEDLDAALSSYPFKHDFLSGLTPGENWLEGYLFPDTYEYYQEEKAVEVINKMLNNFGNKYDQTIADGANAVGRNMHEILTIASMVEREAQKDEEFEMIAGVIYNRLASSDYPYLEIDATVQYAVGHKEALSSQDLKVDSPYNTYENRGLPPGPIASPGYTALYAASHPTQHNYYFYVAMPDGSHLFGTTYSEHTQNIQRANAAFAEAGGN